MPEARFKKSHKRTYITHSNKFFLFNKWSKTTWMIEMQLPHSLLQFMLLLLQSQPKPDRAVLVLNTTHILNTVDPEFVSLALGAGLVDEHWAKFDFSSRKLQNLVKALAPAKIRLGGTAADLMVFVDYEGNDEHLVDEDKLEDVGEYLNHGCEDFTGHHKKKFKLTSKDWLQLTQFAEIVNMSLLFDFNLLQRTKSATNEDVWDPDNARELLHFSTKHNISKRVMAAFQLGNEPNSLRHQLNVSIPQPSHLAKDFGRLRTLLDDSWSPKSLLVGPDVNKVRLCTHTFPRCKRVLEYLVSFVKDAESVLDAITFHHYYVDGHKATLEDFLDINTLKSFEKNLEMLKKALVKINKPLWLSETGSAFGGGAKSLSDTYVAMFTWLDKLGLSALYNISVVIRQSLFHGCNALIDDDFRPNPDFWLTWLHKKLVGPQVLSLKVKDINDVRVYAHCATKKGFVVLFGLNVFNSTVEFDLPSLKNAIVEQYLLQPLNTSRNALRSKIVLLNHNVLEVVEDLPKVQPVRTVLNQTLVLPPFALSFWVIGLQNVTDTVC